MADGLPELILLNTRRKVCALYVCRLMVMSVVVRALNGCNPLRWEWGSQNHCTGTDGPVIIWSGHLAVVLAKWRGAWPGNAN